MTGTVAGLALVAGQASFIAWFALVAAVLHLHTRRADRCHVAGGTPWPSPPPPGRSPWRPRRSRTRPSDPPYAAMRNPWAMPSIGGLVDVVAAVGIAATMLGLVVAAASLVVRFRRSEGRGAPAAAVDGADRRAPAGARRRLARRCP